jgi:hypothetical protein
MLEELRDWRAICELKARYCRLLDTKDWAAYRELFTEDYELDVSQGSDWPVIRGRDAALEQVRARLQGVITVHQVHTPEITVDGEQARGIWAMQDRLVFPNGLDLTGYGHYHERYVTQNGTWKIAALKLTRLHLDMQRPATGG